MEFALGPALIAGLAGTIAMTAMMKMAAAAGMTRMPPMSLIQGAMVSDDPKRANGIGMVAHLAMMGTVVFGILYALLFAGFGTASWLAGATIGLVHGLVAGGMAMPMMGSMHPRMEGAAAFTGTTSWTAEEGRLRLREPGLFGRNYGGTTPVGIVAGHVLYGLIAALVYAALV